LGVRALEGYLEEGYLDEGYLDEGTRIFSFVLFLSNCFVLVKLNYGIRGIAGFTY